MSEPVAKIIAVTIDANDAAAVATFWAELTGTEVTSVEDEGSLYFLSAQEGGLELCIQRVPEPKIGKARVHLDLTQLPTSRPSRRGSSPSGAAWWARSTRWTSTRGARSRTRGAPSSTCCSPESALIARAQRGGNIHDSHLGRTAPVDRP